MFPKSQRKTSTALATITLAALATAAQAEEVSIDISRSFSDVTFDSQFSTGLEIERFDTQGGTRELQAIRIEYSLGFDFTAAIGDNTNDFFVASDSDWVGSWSATDGLGNQVLLNENLPVQSNVGFGYFLGNFESGFEVSRTGVSVGGGQLITEQGFLDSFTGEDVVLLNSNFAISDIAFSEINFPGKDFAFAPELLDITLDRFFLDASVNYIYSTVPTPGALSLLAMGMVPVATRRRRR